MKKKLAEATLGSKHGKATELSDSNHLLRICQPSFENLINKYLNKVNVSVDPGYDDAKYTMIIKTVHTEPGWNIYISRKPAHINVDVLFIETGKPNNILAKMEIDKVPGQTYGGYDFDTGTRLSESYAKLGKDLGKFLSKHFGK